ncbi:hypothetical protein LO762_19365 [Actinocorallia sp. API 0066]|uniref:DUF6879 family protein n=1 Tax=Actinocorallia sp. API 0066 TaxID=2896846 RepID=UPI001E43A335|nr:DUF6879 family protein [Actinocorallia sp. API 0066]MCD0451341.1 hypothetical protein [Actinocorallia sp. API 0066]
MPTNAAPLLTATDPAKPEFPPLFAASTRSAIHLELRDGYAVSREDKGYTAWKAGHRDDPADPASWWRPWLTVIQEATARGVEVRRLRVVSEPLSEYTRFLLDTAFTNVHAGEATRWLPRAQACDLKFPANDFWIFDDEVLIWNHFSGDGVPVSMEWCTDAEVIAFCAESFEAAWKRGIDNAEYTRSST